MTAPIYLDYNATTPIDRDVVDAMLPYLHTHFGNPSSNHAFGVVAKNAVEKARAQVAALVNCQAEEIYFTSGGTESNNLAIKGFALAHEYRGNHIITSAVEHPAVLEVCKDLQRHGFELSIVPVDDKGRVDVEEIIRHIKENTILITVMHANNEVGTIQPISAIAEIAHSHNIAMHTDAAQSLGKIKVDVDEMGVDLLSVAGHKLYAPKGVGALYVRKGVHLIKQMHGANHERNLRPGTENVSSIVGLGKACDLIHKNLGKYIQNYQMMRDLLEEELLREDFDLRINGDKDNRLPNTSSISFHGKSANEILGGIQGIAVSAGAACHADDVTISHVLCAMGVPEDDAIGTIRFSTGKFTTTDEIISAVELIKTLF